MEVNTHLNTQKITPRLVWCWSPCNTQSFWAILQIAPLNWIKQYFLFIVLVYYSNGQEVEKK